MPFFKPDHYYRTTDPELTVIGTRGTLNQWRHQGKGPKYIKLGNRVLYEGRVLNEWLDAHVVHPPNSRVKED